MQNDSGGWDAISDSWVDDVGSGGTQTLVFDGIWGDDTGTYKLVVVGKSGSSCASPYSLRFQH